MAKAIGPGTQASYGQATAVGHGLCISYQHHSRLKRYFDLGGEHTDCSTALTDTSAGEDGGLDCSLHGSRRTFHCIEATRGYIGFIGKNEEFWTFLIFT